MIVKALRVVTKKGSSGFEDPFLVSGSPYHPALSYHTVRVEASSAHEM